MNRADLSSSVPLLESESAAPGPGGGAGAVGREALLAWLDGVLQPSRFKDYGPNGLQVQGRAKVRHVVTGVTASLALIEAAVAAGADALLVHHGLFWRGQDGRITGWMHARIRALMQADINLLAYHLPLDAHPHWGNNAQLARVLGWASGWAQDDARRAELGFERFGEQGLGFLGVWPREGGGCEPREATLAELAEHVSARLQRPVTWVGGGARPVRRLAWCSGGAQGYFEAAIAAGADVFLTGEISEPQAHLARECGVGFVAAGHHATERYGVQALGERLAAAFGLRHTHIDIDNPA